MRLRLLLVLGAVFIILTGFVPGRLPFNPGARYSDAVTSHWGAALFVQKSVLQNGEYPVWRETIMAGAPFAANPLNKTAYPLQWLALLLPPTLHLDFMILLHLLLAGWGMWRWARAQGLRPEAAALSALAYALAPRLIGHTGAGHLDLLYALAWLPWLMEAVRRFTQQAPKLNTASANTLAGGSQTRPYDAQSDRTAGGDKNSIVRIALFAALVFLADVRLSLFALALAAVYALYGLTQSRQRGRLLWLLPAALLFLLLTTSVTLPLLGWMPYLTRAGLTAQDAAVFSLEAAQFIGLILPPQGGNVETLTYAGLPVLALALIAVFASPRRHVFWLAVVLFGMWFALGHNGLLWSLLTRLIPALLWFRVPSRAWLVVALVLPLLAGSGLHWLIERAQTRTPKRWRLYALIGMVMALASGLSVIVRLPLPDAMGWSLIVGGGGLSLILLLLFTNALKPRKAIWLILVVTFADLLITGRSWLEWRGEENWLTPYQPLAQVFIEDQAARIYSPTYSLPQQAAEAYDLRLFGGVDPFQIEGVARAVAQAGGVTRAGYSVVAPPLNDIAGDDPATANRNAIPNTGMLARWDVSHVVAAYPIEDERLDLLSEIGGAFVYRNLDYAAPPTGDTLPRWSAAAPDLPSAETVAHLNRLTVFAAGLAAVALVLSLLALIKTMR